MFKLVVLSACLCVAYAAVALSPLEPKPDEFKNQEGCYMEDLKAVIPFGQSMPSKTSCMEYRCGSNLVTYVTCSALGVYPPCKKVEDHSKPYPECCPRVECPSA